MAYRNIYIKKYNKVPMFLCKGIDTLYYYGRIFYNVNDLPGNFDKTKDMYIDCDCQYAKIKRFEKILK